MYDFAIFFREDVVKLLNLKIQEFRNRFLGEQLSERDENR